MCTQSIQFKRDEIDAKLMCTVHLLRVTCKRQGTNEKERDFSQFFRHLNVRSVDACAPTSSHRPRELQTAEVAERLCAVVE
jgi:hypothetical protein